MIYTLVIQASPAQSEICRSALNFARALIDKGHKLERIFFYGDGVELADQRRSRPANADCPIREWKSFIEKNEIEGAVCISAAQRRGLLDQSEAQKQNRLQADIAPPFIVSGLGQLIEACVLADRSITFR